VQSEAGLPMLENQLTSENAFLSGQITNTTPILKEKLGDLKKLKNPIK
jgi:hypothetical protein